MIPLTEDTGDPLAEAPERFRDTLEAYQRAKWATLHDEGREALVRELASLEHFLEHHDPEASTMEVDVEFREWKAQVLRGVLAGSEDQR